MSTPSHVVHTGNNDLFKHIRPLGRGNSFVDEVYRPDRPSHTFARKCFVLQPNADRVIIEAIQNEIAIMRRLRHKHIIELKGSYKWEDRSHFNLLMSPVADTDLGSLLRDIDGLTGSSTRRMEQCRRMRQWPACLIRALSYIHSMSIRHKDIKPANILINGDNVLLADFGIANDFAGLTTSGTEGRARATWMYAAPEVSGETRRGRSADVFSLGCVMMEMCAVSSGSHLSLESLRDHLRRGRPAAIAPAYCEYPFVLYDWILLSLNADPRDPEMASFIHMVLRLTFLMLDPNQQQRITSRQLADMLSDPRCTDFHALKDFTCQGCLLTVGCPPQDVPLHSVFKKSTGGRMYVPSKSGLGISTPHLWEQAKYRWLEQHIWWVEDTNVF